MVFVNSNKVTELYPIGAMLGLRPVKGAVGLEIEVEGNKFQKEKLPSGWTYHPDNSLRGQDHAEYLLSHPVAFKEVPKLLESLWKMFKDGGSVLAPSNRTSVHVHLNVTEFHLNRLAAFTALYFAFEEILTEWCGEHRVGNLFCLRAKDAPAIVTAMANFIASDMSTKFHDGLHYSGLAGDAIRRHGSLEIRTLRGVEDPEIIQAWVDILERLYDASAAFTDPRKICEDFSSIGPLAFFEEVFGPLASVIRQGAGSDDFIRQSLYEGVRMYAQDLCYARDWDMFKGKDYRADPFGRKPRRKSAGGLASVMDFDVEVVASDDQWSVQQTAQMIAMQNTGGQIFNTLSNAIHPVSVAIPTAPEPDWEEQIPDDGENF